MPETTNYPITPSGSIDMLGDEFPSTFQSQKAAKPSPLAADIEGADTSNWSGDPRPAITAWEGADLDAYWFDNGVWRHCQTGREWVAPVTLEDATAAFCDMLIKRSFGE